MSSNNDIDLTLKPSTFRSTWANYIATKQDKPGRVVGTSDLVTRIGALWANWIEDVALKILARLSGRYVNVMEHGAVGDGVADDTVAINAAMNKATANGTKAGIIFFPADYTYKITAPLVLHSNVMFLGEHEMGSVIKANLTGSVVGGGLTVYDGARKYKIKIKNLTIDNTSRANVGSVGIDLTQVSDAVIEDVRVLNVETGVLVKSICYYNKLYNVTCNTVKDGYVTTNGANSNEFYSCRATLCSNDAFVISEGANSVGPNHNMYFNCFAEEFTRYGFYLNCTTANEVYFNRIWSPRIENAPSSGTGIKVTSTSTGNLVMDPYFQGLSVEVDNPGGNSSCVVFDTGVWRSLWIGNNTSTAKCLLIEDSGHLSVRTFNNGSYYDVWAKDLVANGLSKAKRHQSTEATAVTSSHLTITSGWGSTATYVVDPRSTDSAGEVAITCNGAGITSSPSIQLTYADGAWSGRKPTYIVVRNDNEQPYAKDCNIVVTEYTTEMVATMYGTPVAGTTYYLRWGKGA